ncbi:hypothetical protein CR513_02918, partial [Mucuna pruriens]
MKVVEGTAGEEREMEHLTHKSDFVATLDRASNIKSTLHPLIQPIFRPHVTCESVWFEARALYITTLNTSMACVTI